MLGWGWPGKKDAGPAIPLVGSRGSIPACDFDTILTSEIADFVPQSYGVSEKGGQSAGTAPKVRRAPGEGNRVLISLPRHNSRRLGILGLLTTRQLEGNGATRVLLALSKAVGMTPHLHTLTP